MIKMSILEKLIAMKPPVEGGVTVELNGGITVKKDIVEKIGGITTDKGGKNMVPELLDIPLDGKELIVQYLKRYEKMEIDNFVLYLKEDE